MRYFVKILGFDTPGDLYRFETGGKAIVEQYWSPTGWKRDDAAELVGYLVVREGDFDEISEAKAQEMFPLAFGPFVGGHTEKVPTVDGSPTRIFAKVPEGAWESGEELEAFAGRIFDRLSNPVKAEAAGGKFRVIFEGGSIVGVIDGVEIWKGVQEFLNKKSAEGKLKCFKWWCKECEKEPLVLGGDPAEHVIKISFVNVVKLTKEIEVNWQWEDPKSEWALSHGTGVDAFKELVAKKSQSNWVVALVNANY